MTAAERKQRRRIQARTLRSEGRSIRDIASQLGVSVGTIHADLKPAPPSPPPLAQATNPNLTHTDTERGTNVKSLSSRESEAEHVEGEAEAGGREVETAAQEAERARQEGERASATAQGASANAGGAPENVRRRLPELSNARVKGGDYSDEEVERGLHALALFSGNSYRASHALTEQGLPIPRETLEGWKRRVHPDRYREIAEREVPGRLWRIAEASEELAERIAEAEAEVLDKIHEEMPELSARDAAGALRNLSVSKAVNIDKSNVIRGRPVTIYEDRSLAELLKSIHENPNFKGVVTVDPDLIESTAEEVEGDD